jgi:hypothetical protein
MKILVAEDGVAGILRHAIRARSGDLLEARAGRRAGPLVVSTVHGQLSDSATAACEGKDDKQGGHEVIHGATLFVAGGGLGGSPN